MDVIWLAVGLYFFANGELVVDHAPVPYASEAQCKEAIGAQEAKVKSNTDKVVGYALSCVPVTPKKNEPRRTKDGVKLPAAPVGPFGNVLEYRT